MKTIYIVRVLLIKMSLMFSNLSVLCFANVKWLFSKDKIHSEGLKKEETIKKNCRKNDEHYKQNK